MQAESGKVSESPRSHASVLATHPAHSEASGQIRPSEAKSARRHKRWELMSFILPEKPSWIRGQVFLSILQGMLNGPGQTVSLQ